MNDKRILLVEDDPLLLKLYTDLLKTENFYVETASDGLIGYEKMRQGGWDLVLLDIVLPKLSGLEIVKKLKEDKDSKPNKNVVFLTNLEQEEICGKIKKLGFECLIKSNLNPGQFLDKIKSYF